MNFTNTLTIDRPVTETFAFNSDFEKIAKLNYFVKETANESPLGRAVGTIHWQRGQADDQHFLVTDFEPDRLVAVRTLPPARDLQMRFTFEPHDGGTRLTDDWTLDTGLPRWLEQIDAATSAQPCEPTWPNSKNCSRQDTFASTTAAPKRSQAKGRIRS